MPKVKVAAFFRTRPGGNRIVGKHKETCLGEMRVRNVTGSVLRRVPLRAMQRRKPDDRRNLVFLCHRLRWPAGRAPRRVIKVSVEFAEPASHVPGVRTGQNSGHLVTLSLAKNRPDWFICRAVSHQPANQLTGFLGSLGAFNWRRRERILLRPRLIIPGVIGLPGKGLGWGSSFRVEHEKPAVRRKRCRIRSMLAWAITQRQVPGPAQHLPYRGDRPVHLLYS